MAGWMQPEMNCARNDAPNSLVLCSSKTSAASCWRPNTLTSAWPVYISSMWALSLPVLAHCAMNCGCAFLPIFAATKHRDRHRDQGDHGQHGRNPEHHHEYADD